MLSTSWQSVTLILGVVWAFAAVAIMVAWSSTYEHEDNDGNNS